MHPLVPQLKQKQRQWFRRQKWRPQKKGARLAHFATGRQAVCITVQRKLLSKLVVIQTLQKQREGEASNVVSMQIVAKDY